MFRRRVFIFYWLPVALWMWLIFSASGDTASVQRSSRILRPLLHWLFPNLSPEATDIICLLIRKCAHLTEYAVLSLLVWRALRHADRSRSRLMIVPQRNKYGLVAMKPGKRGLDSTKRGEGGWNWSHAWISVFVVLLYAMTDELHQHFVASRNASVGDVFIDTTGGLMGIVLLWVLGRWRKLW